jgi:hexulose-6-phosphate isomerase
MKIGIMDGSLRQPWETLFAEAGTLGYDGVELGVGADYADTELFSAEGQRALRKRAQTGGAELASVCLHGFWQLSFASRDPEVIAQARQMAVAGTEAAANVGAKVILVPVTPAEGVEQEEGAERWIEQLRQCAPAAEARGVVLAVENVGRGYGKAAADLLRIVEGVGSPCVGVYYDVGNATYFGNDPVQEIGALGRHVAQVHTKERDAELLGEGTVKHAEAIAALQDIGYQGYIMFETAATEDPVAAARHNLAFVRGLLGG